MILHTCFLKHWFFDFFLFHMQRLKIERTISALSELCKKRGVFFPQYFWPPQHLSDLHPTGMTILLAEEKSSAVGVDHF